jgi:predicted TIM-barrel fold metal-dependent hydrolase
MGFVDTDSHIVECEKTWEYLDPNERHHRPFALDMRDAFEGRGGAGASFSSYWVVGDAWAGVNAKDGLTRQAGNRYDPNVLLLEDPSRRIAELDALGIDVQMIYSTIFLTIQVQNPIAEAAIKRSWNRWMAERVADSGGRLAWAAEVPTRMLERAIEEVEFASAHGAKAVRLHGVENHCYLDDPYFDPLFARLEDLGLSVLVHIGRPLTQSAVPVTIGTQFRTMAPFVEHIASPMTGFWTVLVSDIHERYPRLRFFFSEVGANWAPTFLSFWQRIVASSSDFQLHALDPAVLEEKNIFIGCFADEDLPGLTSALGENILTFGTDYGHNDSASQIVGHSAIMAREDLSKSVARKIVDTNGRRAFGIDTGFCPTDTLKVPTTMPYTRALRPEFAGPRKVVGIGV